MVRACLTRAHASHPTRKATLSAANVVDLGSDQECNRRTIYQYIHEGGIIKCKKIQSSFIYYPYSLSLAADHFAWRYLVYSRRVFTPRRCQTSFPNVIIILVDDMGFSDIGAYGGEIKTPHINSLAQGACTGPATFGGNIQRWNRSVGPRGIR